LKIWQVLALTGGSVFFLSGALPLISIHFIGIFSMNLLDLYRGFAHWLSISGSPPEWTEAFSTVAVGFILTAILFPITLIAVFASLRIGPKAYLIGGCLGMICWLGSLFAIIQLKLLIAQLGGPFGGLAASFIHIGYGIYGGILGSAILLLSYLVAAHETKKLRVTT